MLIKRLITHIHLSRAQPIAGGPLGGSVPRRLSSRLLVYLYLIRPSAVGVPGKCKLSPVPCFLLEY